jgi:transcriptional regulator GlxA family with amidase domain
MSSRLGAIPSLITALAAEAAAPVAGYSTALGALGATLVLETARAFALDEDLVVEPVRRDRGSLVVEAMQRHLRDNLSRPITVRDVAAAAHLSERHAERLFTQQTGASIMSTLRRLRLELAAQLLLDPALTVTEVARACGYSDVRPFSTAFRRKYGRTPGDHRRAGGTEFI